MRVTINTACLVLIIFLFFIGINAEPDKNRQKVNMSKIVLPDGSVNPDYLREIESRGLADIEENSLGEDIEFGQMVIRQSNSVPNPDDEYWSDKFFLSGVSGVVGASATVYDMVIYDGDLIIGGNFTYVDGKRVENIARWDGSSWHSLSTGINGYVAGLLNYEGKLVATGPFTEAGGIEASRIAAWDGISWAPLGEGLNNSANMLLEFNGDLIVSGSFDTAGTVNAKYLAKWDGEDWGAIYDVTPDLWIGAALLVHDGYLYAKKIRGVIECYLVRWDGETWEEMSSAPDGGIRALIEHNGELIAGGSFLEAGGVACNNVAAWDGSAWHPLGDGLVAEMTGTSTTVWDLFFYNGRLIAGGNFDKSGTTQTNYIAQWNGTSWQPLAEGMGGTSGYSSWVFALGEYNGFLIAGGGFTIAGSNNANGAASWDGNSWIDISSVYGGGINGTVRSVVSYNGDIIAGGYFSMAGKDFCESIARWHDSRWYPLGEGIDGYIDALEVYNNNLYAAGGFTDANNPEINNKGVYQWDGISWSSIANEFICYDTNRVASIREITIYNDLLIIGGSFDEINGVLATNIASWDGNVWSAMGDGVDWYRTTVDFNGQLIVSGINDLFVWDGTSWNLWGSEGQPSISARALTVYQGDLIGIGDFSEATGLPECYIAAWNGVEWIPFGPQNFTALYGLLELYDITAIGSDLVIVGDIGEIDGMPIMGTAIWDGVSWQPMGSGIYYNYNTKLYTYQNHKLFVFGDLFEVGGKQSINIALWTNKICMDVDGDGKSCIFDIIYVIRYLYMGGPAPIIFEEADIDLDGEISLIDISMMVEYLYIDGLNPDCL